MVSIEEVNDALREVIDPELGLDFVELGLIYDVSVEGGNVLVTYTLTSPGCPIGPQVAEQIEEFVSELEGVEDVQSTMTFSPPWTPELMSEDRKDDRAGPIHRTRPISFRPPARRSGGRGYASRD
jgi:metal-sulfur cluster biosynthetic enzyme